MALGGFHSFHCHLAANVVVDRLRFLEIELKTFFFNENIIDLVYDGVAKAFHHRCDGLFSFDALPRFRVHLVLREHLDLF